MNPFQQFSDWYNDELNHSSAGFPSACCLSTTGLDDYPDARFVSLKEMVDEVRALLKEKGFDRKQIIYEKYD